LKTLSRDEDERLLVEAAQRHPARFAELYERNFDRIYAFIARRVPTREEAQDLTAEAFFPPIRAAWCSPSLRMPLSWLMLRASRSKAKLRPSGN
jgi:DNA-directed RNA polymerase specialized sigma24 family protein